VAAIVSLAVVVVLVACATVTQSSLPTTTLVVWVDTPAAGAAIQSRIDAFTQDHPNIQVKVFNQATKINNGDISIAIEALTGSELSPDVVALTDLDFRLMSNESDLIDLSPYVIRETDFDSSDFFPLVWDAFRDKGKQYAIPSEVVPWMIYYNKDLFDKARVAYPTGNWSTSQFVNDGEQVVANAQGKEQVTGFVTDPAAAMLPFVETYGVVPEDAAVDPFAKWLDDPRTAEAFQWFAGLSTHDKIMPTDPSNRNLGFWFGGRAAMAGMFMDQRNQLPPYMQRQQVQLTPTVLGTQTPPPGWKFHWGVASVPTAEVPATVYYTQGYGIPSASKDPDDAWTLIDYLTSSLPDHPAHAYVPARESLAYSKAFADLYPEDGRQSYLQSVVVGRPLPAYPPAAQITTDELQGILDGSVQPNVGLHSYRDRIQPILAPQPTPTPTVVGSGS
jgi:ABC-type glycerol-3-phosphate transport system substrate-binding protein